MIEDVDNSNLVDIEAHTKALASFAPEGSKKPAPAAPKSPTSAESAPDTPTASESSAQDGAPQDPGAQDSGAVAETKPPKKPAPAASASTSPSSKAAESIRVNVELLDRLMTISGEMVLGRNQLLQSTRDVNDNQLHTAVSNLSQVVSEMQEAVMQTRLQPVGTILQKLPRIVRDLTAKLGKKCQLRIEGKEVEVDRSILEALGDPLTHLVRNALDHGIEKPEVRRGKDKPIEGTLLLHTFHQGGNVKIKIQDDGAGINPEVLRKKAVEKGILSSDDAQTMSDRDARMLIFSPGFSTAKQVSDVSGRGVGMDVVRSNIEALGGTVELQSEVDRGTAIIVTIPLTLAIIPALVVVCAGRRYALPQSNVTELVRVRGADRDRRIAKVKGRDVLRLRGQLLPLVSLRSALGVAGEDHDEQSADSTNIIIVQSGPLHYGLAIDSPPDTEEIVVKQLGKHMRNCDFYSGSTLLGDGAVAMILDVAGLAARSNLQPVEQEHADEGLAERESDGDQVTDFVLFRNTPADPFAVPLSMVQRIQRVRSDRIKRFGGDLVYENGDKLLPVINLDEHVRTAPPEPSDVVSLLVLRARQCEFAILTSSIENVLQQAVTIDLTTLVSRGILGSFRLGDETVRLIDVGTLAQDAISRLIEEHWQATQNERRKVLLVEHSTFLRNHLTQVLENSGYEVDGVENSDEAWSRLSGGCKFDMVVADTDMPGHGAQVLAQRVRSDDDLGKTVIIGIHSHHDEDAIEQARAAGIETHISRTDEAALIHACQQVVEVKDGV
ncbi:MAG TPA: response regulator [bacterium]|nr:response regulator [bacterium]